MMVTIEWRGEFENEEVDSLHAEAFARAFTDGERDWKSAVVRYSLGWVTVRDGDVLVGFVNVIWDGLVHAWIQDVIVASRFRHHGIGGDLVTEAREACKRAGCEWLHVDFDNDLGDFYFDACGFAPTTAGILHLTSS